MGFLRGLFGSSARNMKATPQTMAAHADQKLDDPISRTLGNDTMRRAPILTPDPQADREEKARKWEIFGATLQDMGGSLSGRGGGNLARVQEGYRKRTAAEAGAAEAEKMRALAAELYADDPEAQLLFSADPEAFVAARAERMKPRTMSGGQTYIDPTTGQRFTAPTVEKMDDRFAYYDPETGEARYSEARSPTYQEGTGRMNAEEAARHNREQEKLGMGQLGVSRGNLGVAQGHLGVARTRVGREGAGFSGAGGGGGDLSNMTTQQLIEALRNAR